MRNTDNWEPELVSIHPYSRIFKAHCGLWGKGLLVLWGVFLFVLQADAWGGGVERPPSPFFFRPLHTLITLLTEKWKELLLSADHSALWITVWDLLDSLTTKRCKVTSVIWHIMHHSYSHTSSWKNKEQFCCPFPAHVVFWVFFVWCCLNTWLADSQKRERKALAY